MPSLDDPIDNQENLPLVQQGDTGLPLSPFIERNPKSFAEHVASLLESKEQMKFEELLPEGSTRKTAGIAFHHILSECIIVLFSVWSLFIMFIQLY